MQDVRADHVALQHDVVANSARVAGLLVDDDVEPEVLDPGAAVVYDEPLKLSTLRTDLTFYPVPFDKLVAPVCPDAKLRRLVRNMIYDGILAKLLGIDLALMEQALGKQMEGLGKQMEVVSQRAERETRQQIDHALETGLARPLSPTQRQ